MGQLEDDTTSDGDSDFHCFNLVVDAKALIRNADDGEVLQRIFKGMIVCASYIHTYTCGITSMITNYRYCKYKHCQYDLERLRILSFATPSTRG